jgi:hypothetical protein
MKKTTQVYPQAASGARGASTGSERAPHELPNGLHGGQDASNAVRIQGASRSNQGFPGAAGNFCAV